MPATPIVPAAHAVPIALRVNGRLQTVSVTAERTLLSVLRDDLNLTGAKIGCGQGQCGACTVLLDDRPVYACLVLALECAGQAVRTIEGLAEAGHLDLVQAAVVQEDAVQCGFCTPGQVMSLVALLERNANPTEDDVRQALAGNLCRCGTYPKLIRAALAAAVARRATQQELAV